MGECFDGLLDIAKGSSAYLLINGANECHNLTKVQHVIAHQAKSSPTYQLIMMGTRPFTLHGRKSGKLQI